MVDTLVWGVLHPPRTKEIRPGIPVVGGENAIQRHSADGW